ncbi:20756_t:CDS:2 [Gigaspora margarita]|uniref:20756_t:CDS:1 n=1 Tax=Gigaspora margarita TaxID=4874 RepID=A0ABM8W1U2_GIGMA|nr:20756_t:CDS:2 [Gigaspora margarita]
MGTINVSLPVFLAIICVESWVYALLRVFIEAFTVFRLEHLSLIGSKFECCLFSLIALALFQEQGLGKIFQVTIVEKEIINVSIKLFWSVTDSSATFIRPLEFTTVSNHSCITIKKLDAPDTVLLNGKSYKRIVDEPVHNNIPDLLLPINNVSLKEGSHLEAMVQANYVEHTEKNQANEDELMLNNQISPQEQSKVSIDQYNEQFGFQDDQCTDVKMTDSSNNQYSIILIPNANMLKDSPTESFTTSRNQLLAKVSQHQLDFHKEFLQENQHLPTYTWIKVNKKASICLDTTESFTKLRNHTHLKVSQHQEIDS